MVEFDCIFGIAEDCHAVKKSHRVCKACWNIASDRKREELKMSLDGFCEAFGCWKWCEDGTRFCKGHGGTKRPHEERSPPRRTRRRFNVSDKDTWELMDLMSDCLDELKRRHADRRFQ